MKPQTSHFEGISGSREDPMSDPIELIDDGISALDGLIGLMHDASRVNHQFGRTNPEHLAVALRLGLQSVIAGRKLLISRMAESNTHSTPLPKR